MSLPSPRRWISSTTRAWAAGETAIAPGSARAEALAQRRLGTTDFVLAAALVALLGSYVHFRLNTSTRPEEDAAMLLRYARNVAAGHGIVWNVGERPVDGATDFLPMLLVAGLSRLGLGLEKAARDLGLAAHAATVLLVFFGARRLYGARPAWALVPALFLAIGPALRYVGACYVTPLSALAVAVAWLLASRLALAEAEVGLRVGGAFALASLVMGLTRPEGAFLAVFMLLAVVAARGRNSLRPVVVPFLLVFLTLGLAYFLWRWSYFGFPLPNPYYKKGGGLLHWHSLRLSWRALWHLASPFLALLPLGALVRSARRAVIFTAIPVFLFIGIFVLISDETNYVMRFQYPVVPLLLVGCIPIAQAVTARFHSRVAAPRTWTAVMIWPVALAVAGGLAWAEDRAYRFIEPQRMGLQEAALVLRDYAPRGFTLATSEAGLLPLYSTWRTVDAWGLNDPHVAHSGGIDEPYLDRYRPEVIMFHAYFSPRVPDRGGAVETRSLGPRWYAMVMTLKRYAEGHGYALAACFGRNRADTHYYYVRRGFPKSEEIAARLRAVDYYWDGEPTVDFAAEAEMSAPAPAANASR